MFVVFVCLLALASAAPQYLYQSINHGSDYHHGPSFDQDTDFFHHRHGFPGPHHHQHFDNFFNDNVFDTKKFWSELSTELRGLDDMLSNFYVRFPTSVSREGIEGNEYKITIPLNGYEEKEIVVKARAGLLMVQAIHKPDESIVKQYLDVRNLPSCVNVTGSWTYDKNVLTIIFPLKDGAVVDENKVVTEAPIIEVSTESREEVEPTAGGNIEDVDVGVKQEQEHESEQENMLRTNQIPDNTVEATTYAVDVNGDVEFVPVQYKK